MTEEEYDEDYTAREELKNSYKAWQATMHLCAYLEQACEAMEQDPQTSELARWMCRDIWAQAVDDEAQSATECGEEPGQWRNYRMTAQMIITTTTTDCQHQNTGWRNRGLALRNIAQKHGRVGRRR